MIRPNFFTPFYSSFEFTIIISIDPLVKPEEHQNSFWCYRAIIIFRKPIHRFHCLFVVIESSFESTVKIIY